ncbi:phage tail protein [Lactobacillus sp. 3B(2020)]|uniref:phage tail protein n=1 Tax=Lactobacillus sp. 3B(2020) TaxID=2695882 RepID=UPI0015DFDF02|nr:phage tail protein [Lactobacillus sp. 3B(2020)]QLL69598.1 phage tail protein [Lactobacillus sp. 3B(2020)]
MADTTFDTSELQDANLILYGIKFPWDKKEDPIQMLGQQAATSTTNAPTISSTNLKKGVVHAPGSRAETFVVDSYWKKIGDKIQAGLERAVKLGIKVGVWRIDFNQKVADPAKPGSFVVPAKFGMCYPNGVPNTEAVNNLNHANITYNVDGNTTDGVLKQEELDEELYTTGLQLSAFAHNTDIGGTIDPEPTPLEAYLKANGSPSTAAGQSTSSANS